MRYLMMICGDESLEVSPEDGDPTAWLEEMEGRGVRLVGSRLRPVEGATTVRVRDGEVLLTDGPFAETKEQLGGFYLFECPSLDEAIEWAAKIPGARHGSVEVRPVMDYEPLGYTEHRAAEATA